VAAFGLTVQMVNGLAAVRERMDDLQSRSASQDITLVLLMRVEFLSTDLSRLQQYKALRDQWPDCIRTVMVGSEDDFTTRLKSVRYGADAFLADPLDVTQLVDRLDSLVHGEQATPYHVLIVDDDPEQVSMTALTLQQAGMITSVVTDPSNIFKVMVEQKPELILMDMYMPQCSGAELAAIIRQSDSFVSIPIVFLSVETNAAKQLDAIRSGADDFLVKPIDPEHLVTSVRIRAARTRAMRFFMERDSLTGLLNHTNLKQRLETELQRARRIGTELSFAMIDLDRFKSVNDTYGHLTGDHVLKSLARLLEERLHRTDIIGRYGGEEFGVILFGTSAERARQIMDEIRRSFSRIRQNAGTVEFTVTLSCGIAEYPTFEHAAEIGERADGALYQAKEQGRNRVVIATDSM
jgi:diguanylate cyclase (GGDEF)-like protein